MAALPDSLEITIRADTSDLDRAFDHAIQHSSIFAPDQRGVDAPELLVSDPDFQTFTDIEEWGRQMADELENELENSRSDAWTFTRGDGWGRQRVDGFTSAALVGQDERQPSFDEQQAAERRAHDLLLSMLTPDQRKEVKQHGRFNVVAASGISYRLDVDGGAFNVTRMGADGKELSTHCLDIGEGLPPGDQVLVQKLLIEADEQKFLNTANVRF